MSTKKKTVLCYYNKYKTCEKGDTCTFAHDVDEIIANVSDSLKKIIFEKFSINDNIKIMLVNIKNHKFLPDNIKYDIFNIITLMSAYMIHCCDAQSLSHCHIVKKFHDDYIEFVKSIISTDYYDIEYIKCMLVLYYNISCNDIPKNIIYNNDMFRLLLLNADLKYKYALKMIYFLKYKRTSNDLYYFIKSLNHETIKITYNYDVNWSNKTIYIGEGFNNINLDKNIIKYIVKNHFHINIFVLNIDVKLRQNHDFILELINIKKQVSAYLDINMYTSNLEIIKHILSNDITEYYKLDSDTQANKKIVSIACNINKTKIPYKIVLKSFCDCVKLKTITLLHNDIVIDKISRFLLNHKETHNRQHFHNIRIQELFKTR